MIVREIIPKEKEDFNAVANHPVQSWEWGEFRKKTGKEIFRLGVFDPPPTSEKEGSGGDKAKPRIVYQLTKHPIPRTGFNLLYFPRGPMPDKTMIEALKKLGSDQGSILVKIEPNVGDAVEDKPSMNAQKEINRFLINNGARPGQSFFYDYTFQIDLTKPENELLKLMSSKTRYNIRLAKRHQVSVREDNSDKAFKTYLDLMSKTTERQGFYAHTPDYHQKMWETLRPAGIAKLMLAQYQNEVLAAWILFNFNGVFYYPYGASSRRHRQVMPAYALMWEAIKLGKNLNCRLFDLWGCLGPNPNPRHAWYGFHRFKEGFGGQLVKYIGTYDLVINHQLYPFYNLANKFRWQMLSLKNRIGF